MQQQQQAGSHQAVNQQLSGSQQSGSSSQVSGTPPAGSSNQVATPTVPNTQASNTMHVPESQSAQAGTEQTPAVSSAVAVQAQSLQQQQQQVQQQQVHRVLRIWVELDGIVQNDNVNLKDISQYLCFIDIGRYCAISLEDDWKVQEC